MNKELISAKKLKSITLLGIGLMILLTLTKINPASTIAGYSIFVGIAFFFLEEYLSKTPDEKSGLRFGSIGKDIKKTGIFLVLILPVISVVLTHFLGNLLFESSFINHVLGRTESFLSFGNILLLALQIVIAALGEEIAYRGFFLGKSMEYYPFWFCAVLSSIVFACGHISAGPINIVIFDIGTIFIDRIIYSLVYRKTRNCFVSTISHIISNVAALVLTFLLF